MTQPAPSSTAADGVAAQVPADALIAELESQLGAAVGQNARLLVALRERGKEVAFLREQLADRDATRDQTAAAGTRD